MLYWEGFYVKVKWEKQNNSVTPKNVFIKQIPKKFHRIENSKQPENKRPQREFYISKE